MTKPKKYLTRSEAATLLGVHPQSISNYVERGLISAGRSKTNGFTYYRREEIESLLPDIDEICNHERAIAEYKKELKEVSNSLKNALTNEKLLLNNCSIRTSYARQLIQDCYCILERTQDSKPACILLQILSGTDTKKVCEEFELTPSHLSRECRKALRTFRLLPDYEQLFNENDKLKSEIQNLTASYNLQGEQYDVLASMHQDLVKEYEKNIKINT